MKGTIDNVLLQCERAIKIFDLWSAECCDSRSSCLDSWTMMRLVLSSQDVCRVYYHTWPDEFTPAQYQRLGRLLSYDAVKVRDERSHLLIVSKPPYFDELPF